MTIDKCVSEIYEHLRKVIERDFTYSHEARIEIIDKLLAHDLELQKIIASGATK